jgi:hypothetical protein
MCIALKCNTVRSLPFFIVLCFEYVLMVLHSADNETKCMHFSIQAVMNLEVPLLTDLANTWLFKWTLLHEVSCFSVTDLIFSTADKREMQYQSIRITSLLIKLDDQWLSSQHQLVSAYKQIWCDDQYQVRSTIKLVYTVTVCQHITLNGLVMLRTSLKVVR